MSEFLVVLIAKARDIADNDVDDQPLIDKEEDNSPSIDDTVLHFNPYAQSPFLCLTSFSNTSVTTNPPKLPGFPLAPLPSVPFTPAQMHHVPHLHAHARHHHSHINYSEGLYPVNEGPSWTAILPPATDKIIYDVVCDHYRFVRKIAYAWTWAEGPDEHGKTPG
ncbi:hypothetical protein F4604DRAFT_1912678 [Suillus subluteus]|nr:hypothetical protein F4604DRAFT_1912678 [Suillus subluteus]